VVLSARAKGIYIPSASLQLSAFQTAAEYSKAWSIWKERDPQLPTRRNPGFPKRIAAVAHDIYAQNTGPFALFYNDLGDHNILVDDDYNVVGVIDWAGPYVLPLES